MKFSIIIPTYNSDKSLSKSLDSVLIQKFSDYEVLIIDGDSNDDTLDIIKSYDNKFSNRLRWIGGEDFGIYDAMNKGVDLAKGEWLYFLGSDDFLFNENVLGEVARETDGDVDVVYGNVVIENDSRTYDGEFTLEKLIEKNISHQAICYKKRVFDLLGKYNMKYKTLADWEFNMRWMNAHDITSRYVNIIIANLSKGGASKKIFDNKFYEDFEENLKKYFPSEYLLIYEKIKKKEVEFLRNRKEWILWGWKNKVEFALMHPVVFFRKYIKK